MNWLQNEILQPPILIGFGYGAHICLGAPLARMELKVVLEEVSARLPGLRLVSGQKLEFLPNTSFRGPRSLLVKWGN